MTAAGRTEDRSPVAAAEDLEVGTVGRKELVGRCKGSSKEAAGWEPVAVRWTWEGGKVQD